MRRFSVSGVRKQAELGLARRTREIRRTRRPPAVARSHGGRRRTPWRAIHRQSGSQSRRTISAASVASPSSLPTGTGEQAALGTAFFLAELTASESRSTIVLDDPVSSLDHDHREYLAERLVQEATKRQVVIYTHDLTFLVYLQEAAASEGIELHGQTLERSLDEVGIVRDELPTKAMSPSDRRKELRRRLRFELTPMFKGQKPEYERAADLWVSDLRKGYDQVIEDYVLAGTVRRYHKHVRMKQLFQVKWSLEIVERIEKAMKQASPKTHHEALELYPRAHTADELGAMLNEFDAICDLTAPKSEKQADPEQTDDRRGARRPGAGCRSPTGVIDGRSSNSAVSSNVARVLFPPLNGLVPLFESAPRSASSTAGEETPR